MGYSYPTSTTNVSDSFADHVRRGSVNPGTDYTAAYGSRVYAVASGVVTDTDGNPAGSGGRMIHVDHDDGSGADYLHLSALSVSIGDRVQQGQLIGYSGASGVPDSSHPPKDLNWGYGAHLHISFRRNHSHGYGNVGNIDFDALMRAGGSTAGTSGTPIQNGDDFMAALTPEQQTDLFNKVTWLFDNSKVPGQAFGFLSPINDKIDGANTKLDALAQRLAAHNPDGSATGYDWLPAINNNIVGLYTLLGKLQPGGQIDDAAIDRIVESLKEGLGDVAAAEIAKRITNG